MLEPINLLQVIPFAEARMGDTIRATLTHSGISGRPIPSPTSRLEGVVSSVIMTAGQKSYLRLDIPGEVLTHTIHDNWTIERLATSPTPPARKAATA